ncbi:SDR family NAD(P)-dependent oxidoreductase [Bradyrhizobium betae]
MQDQKVVVVTGGTSGIGRAAALRFARQGYQVFITGRRASLIQETMLQHENIAGMTADAASAEDAERTIAKVLDKWGRLDALVNNAGAGAILPLADVTADRITDIFAVNVLGPKSARVGSASSSQGEARRDRQRLQHLRTQGSGGPLALRSQQSRRGASDAMLGPGAGPIRDQGERRRTGPNGDGRADGHDGIVGRAGRGGRRTGAQQYSAGRRGVPDDVAEWIVQLAGPASAWVTGQVIAVDGGLGLA